MNNIKYRDLVDYVKKEGSVSFVDIARHAEKPQDHGEHILRVMLFRKYLSGFANWQGQTFQFYEINGTFIEKCPQCGGAMRHLAGSRPVCDYCHTEFFPGPLKDPGEDTVFTNAFAVDRNQEPDVFSSSIFFENLQGPVKTAIVLFLVGLFLFIYLPFVENVYPGTSLWTGGLTLAFTRLAFLIIVATLATYWLLNLRQKNRDRERRLFQLEEIELSTPREETKCPQCGGLMEYKGIRTAKCPFCGTEIFLNPK